MGYGCCVAAAAWHGDKRVQAAASRPRRLLAALLATVLLAGCAARVPYPADWQPRVGTASACPDLSGRFRNLAVATTGDDAVADGPSLMHMFFGTLLEGFEVSHVELESLAGGGFRVTPWVNTTPLREVRIVPPGEVACEDGGWVFTTGWEVDGLAIADAILWTGGMLIPAAEKWSFAFGRDAQERLIVHAVARVGGTVLLVFPFSSRHHDAWFSYAHDLPEASRDVE